MSTALTVIPGSEFAVLNPGSEVAEAMAENRDADEGFSEMDLVQVKTPSGGGVHWTFKGPNGPEAVAALEGIIVYKCKKGILWSGDEASDEVPVLVSDDMKVAKLIMEWDDVPEDMQDVLVKHELPVADVQVRFPSMPEEMLPRLFWWDGPNKLPYCEFGSSTKPGSKGKRAKDKQILYLLRKTDGLPLRIELGPTSIMPMRKFFLQMTNIPHYRAVVKLSLKEEVSANGQKYSVVVPSVVGALSVEEGKIIKERYKDLIAGAHDSQKLTLITANDE